MIIEGVLDVVLTDFNYYLKLVKKQKSHQELYKKYIDTFYNDEVNQLNDEAEKLKRKRLLLEKGNIISEDINEVSENETELVENENDIQEVVKPTTFLDIIKSKSQSDDKNYVSHGIYIDEWQGNSKEENTLEEDKTLNSDYVSHGIYIDIYEPKEETKLIEDSQEQDYVSHGVYIDEYISIQKGNKDIEYEEEAGEENIVTDESIDDLLDSIFNEIGETEVQIEEEVDNNDDSIDELLDSLFSNEDNDVEESEIINEQGESIGKPLEDTTEVIEDNYIEESEETLEFIEQEEEKIQESIEEVIVVPTNIRDFIKAHQGSEISFVLKYYSKKDVEKAVNLGKIYRKNGKLYV